MEHILDKFRQITSLLQNEHSFRLEDLSKDVPFQSIADMLSDITQSNIYILDESGTVLGIGECYTMNSQRFTSYLDARSFPEFYMDDIRSIKQTKANMTTDDPLTIFPVENKETLEKGVTTIVPIFIGGQKLGYLILGKIGQDFETQDLLLSEYSATVVGIELLHYITLLEQEQSRENARIDLAMNSLSYSEEEAVYYIFKNISELETRITASKIASEFNLTRSVIVNALRKLESAGLLETQSLGMKGTLIRVKSMRILQFLTTKVLR